MLSDRYKFMSKEDLQQNQKLAWEEFREKRKRDRLKALEPKIKGSKNGFFKLEICCVPNPFKNNKAPLLSIEDKDIPKKTQWVPRNQTMR